MSPRSGNHSSRKSRWLTFPSQHPASQESASSDVGAEAADVDGEACAIAPLREANESKTPAQMTQKNFSCIEKSSFTVFAPVGD